MIDLPVIFEAKDAVVAVHVRPLHVVLRKRLLLMSCSSGGHSMVVRDEPRSLAGVIAAIYQLFLRHGAPLWDVRLRTLRDFVARAFGPCGEVAGDVGSQGGFCLADRWGPGPAWVGSGGRWALCWRWGVCAGRTGRRSGAGSAQSAPSP